MVEINPEPSATARLITSVVSARKTLKNEERRSYLRRAESTRRRLMRGLQGGSLGVGTLLAVPFCAFDAFCLDLIIVQLSSLLPVTFGIPRLYLSRLVLVQVRWLFPTTLCITSTLIRQNSSRS